MEFNWNQLITDINSNSAIVGIISGVITGTLTGIIGLCGIRKNAEATLKIANDNIQFQRDCFDNSISEKKVQNKNHILSKIYSSILVIERNYSMTAIYIETDKPIDSNHEKYQILCEKIDNARLLCDLYFGNELSDALNKISSSMNIYWGFLDWHFRAQQRGNQKQAQNNMQKAYEETLKIQEEIRQVKYKIRQMIKSN